MKKVLVLVMVLAMASAASAVALPWVDGIVTWSISDGKFIGTGTSLGIYSAYPTKDNSLITPTTGTDGDSDGCYAIAGNMANVTDYSIVWSTYAEDKDFPPTYIARQELGVWFSFDIVSAGTLNFLNMDETIRESVYIPEPATMGLLSLGGLVLLRRRRK